MEDELKRLMGALGANVKVESGSTPGKHLNIFEVYVFHSISRDVQGQQPGSVFAGHTNRCHGRHKPLPRIL